MENYVKTYGNITTEIFEKTTSSVMTSVYGWMAGALAISGLTAWYVSQDAMLLYNLLNSGAIWVLYIAELGLVFGLSAAINKISAMTATIMFIIYALLNGATLASIFVLYELSSIASTFFITAGTFGSMALYGATTKTDLTKIRNICYMGLIGIIIAILVNRFLGNSMFGLVINILGVIIFVGLTAYDSQKIKNMVAEAPADKEVVGKLAVLGALTLYLDFVNLFLHLLSLLGKRK